MRAIRIPALLAIVLSTLAISHPLLAQSTNSGLKLSNDKPIQIESDKLEVRDAEKLAIFSGNVTVLQGETLLKAGKMTVYYAADGGSATTGSANIDKLVVENKIYVKSGTQEATGDRGVFDMKTEVLTMTGESVVLSEGPNVLAGCMLTVAMASGEAELQGCAKGGKPGSGRVQMSITPSSQGQ